jgi:hypothetical protein
VSIALSAKEDSMRSAACPLAAAAGLVAAAGLLFVPPALAAQAPVSITVAALNRDGNTVDVPAALIASDGLSYQPAAGSQVSVPPGNYLVAAVAPGFSSTGQLTSQTLVAEQTTITAGGTITLNASAGQPLTVTLQAAGAQQGSLTALACLQSGRGEVPIAAEGGQGVAVYVVPGQIKGLQFSYVATWQGTGGVSYDLAGEVANSIPASPSYAFTTAGMAAVRLEIRAGIYPAGAWSVTTQPGGLSACEDGYGVSGTINSPATAIEYLSPGRWLTEIASQSPGAASYQLSGLYAADRSYSDVFGGAVAGPITDFPVINGDSLDLDTSRLFADPVATPTGQPCCDYTQVAFSSGNTVLDQQALTSWSGASEFQATLHAAGWYELNLTSRRSTEQDGAPAGELSSELTLDWRFRAAPSGSNAAETAVPVTLVQFIPTGLSIRNEAPPNGSTPVTVGVARPAGKPSYRLASVELQASSDGGNTWQTLRDAEHDGLWHAVVADPASGFVALRATVTDTNGDSTVETIYQAWSVS